MSLKLTNRDVASNAQIALSKLQGGGGGGIASLTGNTYYVYATTGYDGDSPWGTKPSTPFATIDYAIGKCTASNGDVILVMPGHAETITAAAGIAADVAGVTIRGLGAGAKRPIITMGTSTAATILVTADSVWFDNLQFTNTIDSLATCISLDDGGTNCWITNCKFYNRTAATAAQMLQMITFTHATTSGAKIIGNEFLALTNAGSVGAIDIAVATGDVTISKNRFIGNFSGGAIGNTAGNATNVDIEDNFIHNVHATGKGVLHVGNTTGQIARNHVFLAGGSPAANGISVTAYSSLHDNTIINAGGATATKPGDIIVVTKTLTSSAIVQTPAVAVTGAAVGTLVLEDAALHTDKDTGLAAGTAIQLSVTNATAASVLGAAVFMQTAVSGLGAAATINMDTASVVKNKNAYIATGSVIKANSTVADCTGAGTVTAVLRFRCLTAGSYIAAA